MKQKDWFVLTVLQRRALELLVTGRTQRKGRTVAVHQKSLITLAWALETKHVAVASVLNALRKRELADRFYTGVTRHDTAVWFATNAGEALWKKMESENE